MAFQEKLEESRKRKGNSIIIICYYLSRTLCTPGAMPSICTGINSFNRHSIPRDEDTEAQGREVSSQGHTVVT